MEEPIGSVSFEPLSGDCQGCGSSQVTLRQGLEVVLKKVAPKSVEILNATNYAAGKLPLYPHYE